MAGERTWRLKSTSKEREVALKRAAKVLKGSTTLTKVKVAERAATYVPESRQLLKQVLDKMTAGELRELGIGVEEKPEPHPDSVPLRHRGLSDDFSALYRLGSRRPSSRR